LRRLACGRVPQGLARAVRPLVEQGYHLGLAQMICQSSGAVLRAIC
jgi:hypothetical protein